MAQKREIETVEGDNDDAELMAKITDSESRLRTIEKEMEKYKLAYKAAKEQWDHEMELMRKLTGAKLETPLFDQPGGN